MQRIKQIGSTLNQSNVKNLTKNHLFFQDPYKGPVVKKMMARVMPELKACPDVVSLSSFRVSRERVIFNDTELLVDTSFSRVKGGFGEVMLVRDADGSKWILKKHNNPYPLEFYFLREARKRLKKAANVHEKVSGKALF